jgi:hypothetical protein
VWFWPIVVMVLCVAAGWRVQRPQLDALVARACAIVALVGIGVAAVARGLHGRPNVGVFQLVEMGLLLALMAWLFVRVLRIRSGYSRFFAIAFIALWEGIELIPTLRRGFVLLALPLAMVWRGLPPTGWARGVFLLIGGLFWFHPMLWWNAFVAKEFLDCDEIGAMLEHMRGERVPKGVGTDGLALDAADLPDTIKYLPYVSGAEATLRVPQKQRIVARPRTHVEIAPYRIRSRAIEDDESMLAPLALDPHDATREIYVIEVDAYELRAANAAGV